MRSLARLGAFQAQAEAMMVDSCTIRRVTGTTTNPTTLEVVPTYATIYSGKCRVQLRDTAATQAEAGELNHAAVRTIVQVPMTVTGVAVDDEVLIAASLDADLVGRTFRVRGLFHKTHATARRIECEETQS